MKSVAFWHVERTGGTSLLQTLHNAGVTAQAHHEPYDDLQGDVKVTFLREPRSRLVSEFVFYWNLVQHDGECPYPISGNLIEYVQQRQPVYGHVPQMDFVGLVEDYPTSLQRLGKLVGADLQEREINRLLVWSPFTVGGSLGELRRALDWACLQDLQTYCRVAEGRVPDTNEMLDYTLDKLRVAERVNA